jgi:hypothetical protein
VITREALVNSMRATVACVASMMLARVLKLPEFYWAPISTIVVLLSTANPLTIAWQRFAGTALGAALGALIGTYWYPNWIVYGLGILICGILSALLRIGSLSFRRHYIQHHPADPQQSTNVDCRYAPVYGSVPGNCGGTRDNHRVAGTSKQEAIRANW